LHYDLAVHGTIYAGGLRELWVYAKDGRVVQLSPGKSDTATEELALDSSQVLMPAATDLHVHLRDWSQSEKETIETGTKSAVAGGVTTVADMPNTEPRVDSAEMVTKRIELLREKSFVDFALHAGVPSDTKEVQAMRDAGAFAVKLYPAELGRFPAILAEASDVGMKVAVHAEDQDAIESDEREKAEARAIRILVKEMDASSEVRFAHVSTFDGATQIMRAKETHSRVTSEVTLHHLFMSDQQAEGRIGKGRRVNPQLRPASNGVKMRQLLQDGAFDFLASDHAPHTDSDKRDGAPGFPALEYALPLFLTKTNDFALATRLYCDAPSKYLGLRKGRIEPGYAADFVIVGRKESKIDPQRFVSKGRVTPFSGETLRYSVDKVIKAGVTIYSEGEFRKTSASLVPPQVH
jgi:dihydroorotase